MENQGNPCSSERITYQQCLRQNTVLICGKTCLQEKINYLNCQEKQKLIQNINRLKYKIDYQRE
jgi:hypothetical protein